MMPPTAYIPLTVSGEVKRNVGLLAQALNLAPSPVLYSHLWDEVKHDIGSQALNLPPHPLPACTATCDRVWGELKHDIGLLTQALNLPPSLYRYLREELKREVIVVLNKVDLAPPALVAAWKAYLNTVFPEAHIVCFASFPKTAEATGTGETSRTYPFLLFLDCFQMFCIAFLCVCVLVCACVCACKHLCMQMFVCVCVREHLLVCVHSMPVYAGVWMCVWMCVCVCVCGCVCVDVCVCVHMQVCVSVFVWERYVAAIDTFYIVLSNGEIQ